ncbi:hypothetical protein ACFY05_27640 [Microtetraspora fusca]|uniref:Uncharacterized protein n=1 Tax=Microtetraspora fusca TaxID=1997 RepID=A0ABW6VC95_MICFU
MAIDDPRMNLICHTAHDDHIDLQRISSIMKMRAPDEVVAHTVTPRHRHSRGSGTRGWAA